MKEILKMKECIISNNGYVLTVKENGKVVDRLNVKEYDADGKKYGIINKEGQRIATFFILQMALDYLMFFKTLTEHIASHYQMIDMLIKIYFDAVDEKVSKINAGLDELIALEKN